MTENIEKLLQLLQVKVEMCFLSHLFRKVTANTRIHSDDSCRIDIMKRKNNYRMI